MKKITEKEEKNPTIQSKHTERNYTEYKTSQNIKTIIMKKFIYSSYTQVQYHKHQ